jgi:hypothetical protein
MKQGKTEDKVVGVLLKMSVMKAYGSGGTVPCILNKGTRWR